MYRKHTKILFLWGFVIILSLSTVTAEVALSSASSPTPTQSVIGTSAEDSKPPPQETSDITIEPTKSFEASETVVIVGGGADGAAAAVELPLDGTAPSGVKEQVASSEPPTYVKDTTVSQSSGQSQTDTIPEVVSSPPDVSSASGGGKTDRTSRESGTGTSSQPTHEPNPDGSTPASVRQDVVPPQPAADQSKPSVGGAEADGQGGQQVVSPSVVTSSPSPSSGGGAGLEHADNMDGTEFKSAGGDGAGVDNPQDNSDATQPQAKVDVPVPDLGQVPETIDPSIIGTGEKPSNLPTGVGGMAVEPDFSTHTMATQHQLRPDESQRGTATDPQHQPSNPEGEGDFPTFDKWSVQYLAEQEKQKIEKEQEQAVKPGAQLTQKKLRQNFAAEGCGAKVVSSNAEAENVNFLLNGNPDEYMISPCKAKKWFVVELCEPVQIHKVELGTLELFSSPPKSFRVASSQRFPTKDWTLIGQFDMTPDRSLQSFHTQVSEEFVKFLRVEMLEHHGKEHYCPLTTLRVLGIDMALDDEDDHDSADTDGQEVDPADRDGETDGAISLFNSAKETVVKLVQKVLYKGEKEEKEESAKEKDNATKVAEEENKPQEPETTPCPIKDAGQTTTDAPAETAVVPPPTVETPDFPPAPQEQPPQGKDLDTTETPIITKLDDTEQLPMGGDVPIVVKLDPEEGDKDTGLGRGGHSGELTNTCPNYVLRPFFLFMSGVSLATLSVPQAGQVAAAADAHAPEHKPPVKQDQTPISAGGSSSEGVISKDDSGETIKQPEKDVNTEPMPGSAADMETVPGEVTSGEEHPTLGDTQSVSSPVSNKPSDAGQRLAGDHGAQQATDSPLGTPAAGVTTDKAQLAASSGQASPAAATQQKQWREPTLEPSSVADTASPGNGLNTLSSTTSTPTLDIAQASVLLQPTPDLSETIFLMVDPSPTTEDGVSADHVVPMTELPTTTTTDQVPVPEGNGGGGGSVSAGTGTAPGTGKDQAHAPTPQTGQTVNVTGSEPVPASKGQPGRVPDLVKVGMPSGKRDASVMKLNNRIVALEQNVSMTKKYLEELSRAFKQQNEEMMKVVNKTEGRLASLVARSEEKDLVQQTAIAVLEQKVANLTQVIEVMQLKMDTMSDELWKGQVLLGFLQALAFLWLFTNSATGAFTRKQSYHLHTPPAPTTCTRIESLSARPSSLHKPQVEGERRAGALGGVAIQRRNSDGSLQQQSAAEGQSSMKKLGSESNLSAVSSPMEESAKEVFSQNSKKKKKKKQRHSHMILEPGAVGSPGSVLSESAKSTPAQSPSFSSSAGVLFGTTGASVSQSHPPAIEPQESAIATTTTTTTAAAVTAPTVMPTLSVGEMKENSPVGDAGLMPAYWPDLQACRMYGDLVASRTPQAGLQSPWAFRFPMAQPSPGLCHAQFIPQYGPIHYPHSISLAAPPLMPAAMPGLSQQGSGGTSPSQPFLDLSNSLHQTAAPGLHQQSPSPSPPLHMASPEFKLPAYRRNKIRRVSESGDDDPSGDNFSQNEGHHNRSHRPNLGSTTKRTLMASDSRRRKSDFVNPKPWEEFFLAKNYLSENRFKFPASPPRECISRESHTPDSPKSEACALSSSLDEGRSSEAGSCDRRSDFVPPVRFHPITPSFIPLQQHSLVPTSEDRSRGPSPVPVVSPSNTSQQEKLSANGDRRRNTLALGQAQHSEPTTPNTNGSTAAGPVGGKKMPTTHAKTHRRQGSYPLDQSNTARHSGNKSHPKGQASGLSQRASSSGQPGNQQTVQHPHQHQGGSKFKKAPPSPGQSRKGAGTKHLVSQPIAAVVAKPRHVAGMAAMCETPVTLD